MSRKISKATTAVPARTRIVRAAWDLFHENGLDGTSIDEILKKSKTGKSQLYYYFKSKEGLVHAMLEEALHMMKNGEIEGINPIETWDDLHLWFEAFINKMAYYNFCRACPLGRFAAELSKEDEAIRKDVLLIFEAMKQYPKEFFIKMKAKGKLKNEADPDSLADFCLAVLQGAALLSKIYRDESMIRQTVKHAYTHLRSFEK